MPEEPADPYAEKMRRFTEILLQGPGALDATTREALAAGRDVPAPLAAYAAKVTRFAYRVTDDDIQALKAAGYTEDQILEATLSVAFGAARLRLDAGLAALAASADDDGVGESVHDATASGVMASEEQEH